MHPLVVSFPIPGAQHSVSFTCAAFPGAVGAKADCWAVKCVLFHSAGSFQHAWIKDFILLGDVRTVAPDLQRRFTAENYKSGRNTQVDREIVESKRTRHDAFLALDCLNLRPSYAALRHCALLYKQLHYVFVIGQIRLWFIFSFK